MYFKMNKQDELKQELQSTVFNTLRNPKYTAVTVGTEWKEAVLAEITAHLDEFIARGKEKQVDRVLASVKDKLMKAPQFDFNHEASTGTIVFTYHEPPADVCPLCKGKGVVELKRTYCTAGTIATCPDCNGTGKEKEWDF